MSAAFTPRLAADKLADRAGAVQRRAAWREAGESVVFTNGVFDLVHRGHVDLLAGLRHGGWVLVNSTGPAALTTEHASVLTVPATDLALRHIGKPVPNAALLGGFAALTGRLRLESVLSAIRDRFPAGLAEGNVVAAREAYRIVRAQREEFVDA